MSVIIEKSVCIDCDGLSSCMRLKRLNPGITISDEMVKLYERVSTGSENNTLLHKRMGRPVEVFEIIITRCSMKEQYEMRKKMGTLTDEEKEKNILYYCGLCKVMHKQGSEIGRVHIAYKDIKEVA